MKVLLINLPLMVDQEYSQARFFPQNLAIISALLKSLGHQVELLDFYQFGLDKTLLLAKTAETDAVAFGGMINQFVAMRQIAELIKNQFPHLPLIIGGPLISASPQIIKSELGAQALVIGEAELALKQALKGNKVTPGVYQSKDYCDLNNQPLPDFGLFDLKWYLAGAQRLVLKIFFLDWQTLNSYIFSRGCPYSCKFCCKGFGKKLRWLDFNRVISEIDIFYRQGMSAIKFQDDNFTILPKDYLTKLCNELSKRKIIWAAHSRIDQVDESLLRLFKESGCVALKFGVESFSQQALLDCGKNTEIKQIAKIFNLVRKAGIEPIANVVLGLPGESAKDLVEFFSFVQKEKINTIPYILCPLPGTYYFEQAIERGLITDQVKFFEYCCGWEKKQLEAERLFANLTDLPDRLILDTYQEFQDFNLQINK